ncbi:MAG: translation elongation factor Ts [Myxococcota bacterium]|nr:translation elongation factor Ts [Myxococcota bacterium]
MLAVVGGRIPAPDGLVEGGGDVETAIDWLRAKGIAKAAKKAGRAATDGAVGSYIHAGGKIGVLVEVNCETDFAARSDQFQALVRDLAMHIAAAGPLYVRKDEIPGDELEREKAIQLQRVIEEGKPEHIAEKIVDGRLGKWYQDVCLLEQKFVKDDDKTIEQVLQDAVSVIGENIQIRRFSRYVLGEGLDKKVDDFASEVAAQAGLA